MVFCFFFFLSNRYSGWAGFSYGLGFVGGLLLDTAVAAVVDR
jgi:hypothetical protein